MNAKTTSPDFVPGEEVERMALNLFGPKAWPSRMADAFGVHHQTVRRWRSEGAPREAFTGHLARYAIRLRRLAADLDAMVLETSPQDRR